MIRLTVGAALAAILAACSPGTSNSTSATPTAAAGGAGMGAATIADFKTATPVKDLMAHVIDFASFGVWNRQGWLIDKDGMHDLFPATAAEWVQAESAAFTLAEASNTLLLPGRPPDDDKRWVDNAHALYAAAMKAQAAALKASETFAKGDAAQLVKDKQAFFDAGGDMYEACVTCHAHYVQGDQPGPDATLKPLPNRTPPPNQ